MAEAPWIKFFPDDFLQGIGASNLTAEETGVYIVVLSLIAARGAPVEDDRRWLAGRANVGTRRLNQIVDRLIGLGKLEKRGSLLGNRRMVAEVGRRDEKSKLATKAAMTRWHGNDGPQLPLGDGFGEPDAPARKPRRRAVSPEQPDIKSRTSGLNPENNVPKKGQEPQKSATSPMQTHHSLARAPDSEVQKFREGEGDSTSTVGAETEPAPGPDPVDPPAPVVKGPDPVEWVNRFGQAAGVAVFPSRPQHFADQVAAVARWFSLGLDPEADILPILHRDTERTEQPRYSLAYFDAHMAKAAARKDRPRDPQQRASDPAEHASPLVRAAMRAAAAREGG